VSPKLKATLWFGAGMAFGEFVLRWFVHAFYLVIIAALLMTS
jgi:hypothetical protein